MKTITEYIQKKHITVSKSDNSLAQALAILIWSHCDNNEFDEDCFEKENSDCVIFKPKNMSDNDVLTIYNFCTKTYHQFENINFINNDECAYIGDVKTWIDIKCDFLHKGSYANEIYLTNDVKDELIKQSN